ATDWCALEYIDGLMRLASPLWHQKESGFAKVTFMVVACAINLVPADGMLAGWMGLALALTATRAAKPKLAEDRYGWGCVTDSPALLPTLPKIAENIALYVGLAKLGSARSSIGGKLTPRLVSPSNVAKTPAVGDDLLKPGPWARESVPSSTPGKITQSERDAL